MPCVGNDVVDLKEQANAGKSRDSRFLKKILTDAEIEFVGNVENPDVALWSLWACKETAYKILRKSFPDIAFIPRRWRVVFNIFQSEYAEGKVVIKERDGAFIRLFSDSQYVHCIGSDSPAALDKITSSVDPLPEKETDPSVFLRCRLAHHLAGHFSWDVNQISIKRMEINGELVPPRVYVGDERTDIDMSFSHDGRFVAYVVSQTESPFTAFRGWFPISMRRGIG